MTPQEEIYQKYLAELELQRQRDEAEANHQAYLAKTRPYETYQTILRIFASNDRCNPRQTCISRIGEVSCYHPETKEFAVFHRGEWEKRKEQGWKAITNELNFAIYRFSIPESEQYQLTDADIPVYPYPEPPHRYGFR
ncbi:MAG: hypothetical protein N4J56_002503 [Chroococcidiopsis sp. SAG 2025]|uniref:hypothetical protein n=1 Tax=Chroococcidiopsis sp. SAG 2025 TaxID=171389 RepID=UPI0029370D2C|nr:hypothetical protein [Chroococcidiopsis sp. SAG 2025]MDV2992849.1 hypothetical protein [Chroococcidiopsis sp. SAG 2025]